MDVVSYMKGKGFAIYEIFSGHNRPFDGARAQADIAFVKEKGSGRRFFEFLDLWQVFGNI